MGNIEKLGHIVWHDLHTTDISRARSFYERVAGWNYATEHAKDFTWEGGEKDYVLALAGGEAHAGFVERRHLPSSVWLPFVEVANVDQTARRALALGASVEKEPFEVEGVGRNALLRDPFGVLVGLCMSRHDYPAPRGQFSVERLLMGPTDGAVDFYAKLFRWAVTRLPAQDDATDPVTFSVADRVVAAIAPATSPSMRQAVWSPVIGVQDLPAAVGVAQSGGGAWLEPERSADTLDEPVFLRDPVGAVFGLETGRSTD